MRKKQTKIVATISDLNHSVPLLKKMFEAGLNVVRLNTAHMGQDGMKSIITNVRKVSTKIAILVDTKGPEIRTSEVLGPITFKKGDKVQFSYGTGITTKDKILVNYSKFCKEVLKGTSILIDDGQLEFEVTHKNGNTVTAVSKNPGTLKSRKTVNVPSVHMKLPSVTPRDKSNIEFAIKHKVDFIAHSFVRNKEDVLAVQRILDKHKSPIKIIAKIEDKEGVKNIDEILDHAYGLMVARGDLAIEIPAETVPMVQKKLIHKCIDRTKPIITATQMLESMIDHPRPTRAEVSDVANAIYDGTDAVMLSGETATGKYPVETIKMMSRIAKQTELQVSKLKRESIDLHHAPVHAFIAKAALYATLELPVDALVVYTKKGETPLLVSAYRSKTPVHAVMTEGYMQRQLSLSYGIYPHLIKKPKSTDELVSESLNHLVKKDKLLKRSDTIVIIGGTDINHSGCNFLEVNTVEKALKHFK